MKNTGRRRTEDSPRYTAASRDGKSHQMKKLCALILCALLSITALRLTPGAADVYVLPLFETSDTHGYLADTSGDEYEYRLAFIADKVKDVRGHGELYDASAAVLVDGGDIYQGNSLSNLLHGDSVSAAYQIMGYDAVTVGNHEFDWGIENTVDPDCTMKDYSVGGQKFENTVPVTACNIYKDGKRVTFTKDCVILEKTASSGGKKLPVRVGVIGFASDYASSIMDSKFTGAGYSVREDYAAAEALALRLESEGECDVTVLLTHGEASEAAARLSVGSPVDLVLGGHTHRSVTGTAPNGVRYAQPACYGGAYVYCELRFTQDNGKAVFDGVGRTETVGVTSDPSRLYNNEKNSDTLDLDTVLLSDMFIAEIREALNEKIGFIDTEAKRYVFIRDSGERACTMGNWLASVTARAVEADDGFINTGGLRLDIDLRYYDETKDITASDVYAMFPFENRIYCYELTYAELLRVLEYSLTPSGSTLLSRMTGVDCYYTGQTVNAIVKDGEAVYHNGVWRQGAEDEKIRVAVSEFIATSDRQENGSSNPLYVWRQSERVISSDTVDSEGALRVLREEAGPSHGLLYIDRKPHYINKAYAGVSVSGLGWELSNGVLTVNPSALSGSPAWRRYGDEIGAVEFSFVPSSVPAKCFDGCAVRKVVFPGTEEEWYGTEIADETLRSSPDVTVVCTDGQLRAWTYLCRAEGHLFHSITVRKPMEEQPGVRQLFCERCGETEYEDVEYVKPFRALPFIIGGGILAVCAAAAAVVITVVKKKRKKPEEIPE